MESAGRTLTTPTELGFRRGTRFHEPGFHLRARSVFAGLMNSAALGRRGDAGWPGSLVS